MFIDVQGKLGIQNRTGAHVVPTGEWFRVGIHAQIPDFVKVFCNNTLVLKVQDIDQNLALERVLLFGKSNQLDTGNGRECTMLIDTMKISLTKDADVSLNSRISDDRDYSSVQW